MSLPSKTVESSLPPLQLGPIQIDTPVVLAPMAGVTDPPFRKLCRLSAEAGLKAVGYDLAKAQPGRRAVAGLFVTEMITSRALVEKIPKTMVMVKPEEGDPVRSVQIYGVDPVIVGKAVETLLALGLADHIDLNFGCPAAKVTRKGGGAALPYKRDLFYQIVKSAVQAAEKSYKNQVHERYENLPAPVPITVKTRIGIDLEHQTYLDAGRLAREAGASAVCLHGRTLAQYYSGHAHWDYIAKIVEKLDIPVIGNGDVFSAADAQKMVEQTGCAAVEIGRGAQGAPWIFTELAAWAHGGNLIPQPTLGQVVELIKKHAELLCAHQGQSHGLRELRKHISWYLRGYPVGGPLRNNLAQVDTLEHLHELLDDLDLDAPFGRDTAGPRGRAGGEKRPRLPEGWLESSSIQGSEKEQLAGAEDDVSGG